MADDREGFTAPGTVTVADDMRGPLEGLGCPDVHDERISLMGLLIEANGRLTMSELASQILLTSGGVTRLIDRMVDSGYVERQSCPTDRRTVYVALTPAGTEKLTDTTAVHVQGLERHFLAPLDEHDRVALRTALTKLVGPGPVCGG